MNKLKKLVPKKIRLKFTNRPVLQKIVKNISWLTLERIFQLVLSVLIGIWVARYLGPADYGLMNFAIAFTTLFTPIIGLGTSTIVLRELIKYPKKKDSLCGTFFWITFLTSIIAIILVNAFVLITRPNDLEALLIVLIFSLNNLFYAFDIVAIWFDSKTESHKTVISRNTCLLFSNALKIIFILTGFPLLFFALTSVIESIIRLITYSYFYKRDNQSFSNWKFDFTLAKKLISISWPLIFSGLMIVLYMKMDQVMIGLMLSDYEVGLYSVAVKISEVFYFLPGVIMVSLLPSLIKSKKISKKIYFNRLQKLFDFMTWAPILLSVPLFFLATPLITFLYGASYVLAGTTLSILIISLSPAFIKVTVENYLLNENLTKIVFVSSILGAITNLILNLILIPLYGINGAAIATIISYIVAAYGGTLLFKETRFIFKISLNSFNVGRILIYLMK